MRRNKAATKRRWHNGRTSASPSGVAEAFLHSNFQGSLLEIGAKALSLFKGGNPWAAKKYIAEHVSNAEFGTSLEYLRWTQFCALFLKSSLRGTEERRKAIAIEKFIAAEKSCTRTNRRLRWYGARPERENPIYRVVLSRARELISRTLGNFSEDTLEHILELARPGSGVAIGSRDGSRTAIPFKLAETDLVCTEAALPYARMLVEGCPPWFRLWAEVDWSTMTYRVPYAVTQANRITVVPKDATVDRTIAVEPHLNVCLQLGVHEYLARRLRGVGIDLSDQSRNQRGALEGSLRWRESDPLVTLDLASASDSVSIALVERLVPTVWREFLDALRSPRYTLQGATHEYQKWSSMGNGYTFVLESLIFWALARACASLSRSEPRVMVYGDDIIVHRGHAALLVEVLKYCGFSVNTDKSSFFGPFRESCGCDVWSGDIVTPIYLRGMTNLAPTDIHRLVNRATLPLKWGDVVAYVLSAYRSSSPLLYGLECEDDTSCIFTTLASLRSTGSVKWCPQIQNWVFKGAVFRPSRYPVDGLVGLASSLLGMKFRGREELSPLRRRGSWTLIRRTGGRKLPLSLG